MSLVARTALAVGLVGSLMLAVLGTGSYLEVRDRTIEAEQVKAEVRVQGVAARLEARLQHAQQSVDALSRSAVIRHALLDSAGRGPYIQPVLDSVAQIDGQAMSLSLVDPTGRSLIEAGAETGTAPEHQAWLRGRVESGTPGARLFARDGLPPLVVVAYPVVLPNTRSVAGAMAIRVSTDALLAGLGAAGDTYGLVSLPPSVAQTRDLGGADDIGVRLRLPAPLEPLGLSLQARIDRSGVERALARMRVGYLGLALAGVAAIVVLSVFAARWVTLPLRSLVAEAQRIAAQGPAEATIMMPPAATGELAVLVQSLAGMLAQLNAAAEAQRHSLETQFRAIFDPSPIGMTLADTSGSDMQANSAFLTMIGHTADELRQLDYISVTHPDDRARNLELLQATVAGQLPGYRYEKRLRRKSGEYIWVVVVTSPLRDQQGRVSGVVSQVEDITERKRIEEALRASEERYRRIVETAREGIWVIDADNVTTLANARMGEILGWKSDELIGTSMFDHMNDEGRSVAASNVERRRQGIAEEHEFPFRRKDGGTVWCLLATGPLLDAEGRYTGALAMVTDITERKRADEQIRVALRDREILLKEIYHRVKNNLQVIASLLNLQGRNDTQGGTRALLEESANRVKSMALVHEQLYQGGDLSSIDFSAYLGQLVRHLADAHGAASQRVSIRLDVAPVRLGIETAVPLGLILNELLSNAYKHAYPGERGGAVVLRLTLLDDGRIEVVLSDRGVGLPPGLRLEEATTLGMRLVSSLTEQLEGSFACAPNDGGGTRFTLRFASDQPERRRMAG